MTASAPISLSLSTLSFDEAVAITEASRAWTATVTQGADLPAVLDEAIRVATVERRQVLLNIAIGPDL
jgi:thiamine pyrophosphate-dependent acetolactate synthase large subunit-like protein